MILDSLVNKMEQIRNAEISEAISTDAQIIGAIEEFTVEMWLDYYDVFDLAVEKWSKPHKRTLLHDYIEAVYLEGQNYTLDKHFPGPVIKELKNILNAYNVDYSMASHINSTARDSLNGATPFDLAELLLDKRIPALTGQQKVSPDSVMLKPALINK